MHATEAFFYNAVALALEGDPAKIRKIKKLCGRWSSAYQKLAGFGATPHDPEREWNRLAEAGVRLILAEDQEFPSLLKEIPHPSLGIYIKGGPLPKETGASPIAIVGTRRATQEGKMTARQFAKALASAGTSVVSGLALGIDGAAHEGCLDGRAPTVAVLAGGLDDVYPHEHASLAKKILSAGGAIVSEYPLGAIPYPTRFLERNRIVSGLARGTLIVEAPEGSGALVTARRATEAGRDVFVVPGPATSSRFKGSHWLIRQGAELVTSPQEILEAYGAGKSDAAAIARVDASPHETLILEALHGTARALEVDKIAELTKLEPRIVNTTLSFLLIKDVVKETGEGYTI